jgi:methylated-DNA-protein-cysteine methyltransferase-like protein
MPNLPQEAVFHVLVQVPEGKVLTYGSLASLAGLGRAARFVGSTLRKLPKNTQLPWHRVINSQGRLSLPDSHPSYKLQRNRLISEGVVFRGPKVDLKTFHWHP